MITKVARNATARHGTCHVRCRSGSGKPSGGCHSGSRTKPTNILVRGYPEASAAARAIRRQPLPAGGCAAPALDVPVEEGVALGRRGATRRRLLPAFGRREAGLVRLPQAVRGGLDRGWFCSPGRHSGLAGGRLAALAAGGLLLLGRAALAAVALARAARTGLLAAAAGRALGVGDRRRAALAHALLLEPFVLLVVFDARTVIFCHSRRLPESPRRDSSAFGERGELGPCHVRI